MDFKFGYCEDLYSLEAQLCLMNVSSVSSTFIQKPKSFKNVLSSKDGWSRDHHTMYAPFTFSALWFILLDAQMGLLTHTTYFNYVTKYRFGLYAEAQDEQRLNFDLRRKFCTATLQMSWPMLTWHSLNIHVWIHVNNHNHAISKYKNRSMHFDWLIRWRRPAKEGDTSCHNCSSSPWVN